MVVPVAGGTPQRWAQSFAEQGGFWWLTDGSILLAAWLGQQSVSLFKVKAAGQVESLGAVPHVASFTSFSADLRRATLQWRDYRGDAWLYRVVAPGSD